MARSPSVAKPGDTTPRKVRSKPMRPTWIANRVAMKPRTQPRSIDARADSSSASRRARARTSGSSGSSRSATAVSPASPAVNTGERKMFTAVPKIRAAPAAATVHATIARPRSTSSAPQTRRLPRPAEIQARADRRVSLRRNAPASWRTPSRPNQPARKRTIAVEAK